jgi:hypothetical protein
MTQAHLLRQYKIMGLIELRRLSAGRYYATLKGTTTCYNIENEESRCSSVAGWVITTVSGEGHDNNDDYLMTKYSLTDAQVWIVNNLA